MQQLKIKKDHNLSLELFFKSKIEILKFLIVCEFSCKKLSLTLKFYKLESSSLHLQSKYMILNLHYLT